MADQKDYRELVSYLIKEKISPEVALGIVKRASKLGLPIIELFGNDEIYPVYMG